MSLQVPENSPFAIDTISGEIRTKTKLDFEEEPVHFLVVTAKDGGKEPRIATATVTVKVQDTSDEAPIFLDPVYQAEVPENVEDYLITTVKAEDKDTETSITYRLVQGDKSKFAVDPVTGNVRTLTGLDFERQRYFELIIGTEEAMLSGKHQQLHHLFQLSMHHTQIFFYIKKRLAFLGQVNDNCPNHGFGSE